MNGINVCATLGGNLGKPDCDVRMGRLKYILPTISGEFTEDELADSDSFEDALQAKMLLANSDPNKVFAFPLLRDVTNNTGDPALGTLADGFEEVLNEALPKYLLRSTPGTCVHQQMASFNGWPGKLYAVDDANILWYRVKTAGGGMGWTTGNLYTNPPSWKGSGDVQTANTRVTFGSTGEFKTNVGALKLDFEISDLSNLKDVVLDDREDENDSGALNNVLVIGGRVKCEGTELHDMFAALLNAVARWRAYTADGTAITIDSVALAASVKGWTLTLNSVQFNALPAGTVFYIDLQAPVDLKAANIPGIEAIRKRFVKFA